MCSLSLSTSRLTGREPLVFLPGPFSNEAPTGKAHLKQCEQMTLTRRQKRLCRREPGLAETLRESVRLSLLECRYQFRNERWNCSLDGRGSLLKRGKPAIDLAINWCVIKSDISEQSRCLAQEHFKRTHGHWYYIWDSPFLHNLLSSRETGLAWCLYPHHLLSVMQYVLYKSSWSADTHLPAWH